MHEGIVMNKLIVGLNKIKKEECVRQSSSKIASINKIE